MDQQKNEYGSLEVHENLKSETNKKIFNNVLRFFFESSFLVLITPRANVFFFVTSNVPKIWAWRLLGRKKLSS